MTKTEEVRRLLAQGNSQRALEALTEHLQAIQSPRRNDATLLLGQLKQYKRDRALGAVDSTTELRRIERSIIDLLDEVERGPTATNQPAATGHGPAPRAATTNNSTNSSKGGISPLMIGIGGAVLVVLIVLASFMGEDETDGPTDNSATTETTIQSPGGTLSDEAVALKPTNGADGWATPPDYSDMTDDQITDYFAQIDRIEVKEDGGLFLYRRVTRKQWEKYASDGKLVGTYTNVQLDEQGLFLAEGNGTTANLWFWFRGGKVDDISGSDNEEIGDITRTGVE